jgi:hypothetical protein
MYDANVGSTCAASGTCKGDLKCTGAKEVASATCTGKCTDDTDCPMDMNCTYKVNNELYCQKRKFCDTCYHSGHCAAGGACVQMDTGSFCTVPCNKGTTECPRYASCLDIGGGQHQCLHNAGSCTSFGNQCDPCVKDSDCKSGASCMTFYFSKESFCSNDCTEDKNSCPKASKCIQTSQTKHSCIPEYAPKTLPKCVDKIAPMMEIGDTMHDYKMVGVVDTNGDGLLTDEQLRLIKFSDFEEHHKLILFNISAGWCSACQKETLDFKSLLYQYEHQGLVIFQVLYDGFSNKGWTFPDKNVLDQWNKNLKPGGVVGVDPERNCVQYNSKNSTPLNMIIDAKTRKVLDKWNGYSSSKAHQAIKKFL